MAKKLICCPDCKSSRIQESVWRYVNTGEIVSECCDYLFCANCDTEFKAFIELPYDETREACVNADGTPRDFHTAQ